MSSVAGEFDARFGIFHEDWEEERVSSLTSDDQKKKRKKKQRKDCHRRKTDLKDNS